MAADPLEALADLPRGEHADVAAGYIAAGAAAVATLINLLVFSGLAVLGAGIDLFVNLLITLVAIPLAMGAAFLVGMAGWRIFPYRSPASGVFAGVLGVFGTYLIAMVLAIPVLAIAGVFSITGNPPGAAVGMALALFPVAVMLTGWITIPVACTAGYFYLDALQDA